MLEARNSGRRSLPSRPKKKYSKVGLIAALACVLCLPAAAQTVDPRTIFDPRSPACGGGSKTEEVCITLPPQSNCNVVDVFLLFDDTGSFDDRAVTLAAQFPSLAADLKADAPGVDFAFGVGRFEDFGAGWEPPGHDDYDHPFILNQAILSAAATGFDSALGAALSHTASGSGGDGPESAIEALWQVAVGSGFDGNGNGSLLDSGVAGDLSTQTSANVTGDVPPFSTYVGSSSGILGGVGWRRSSCARLVLLATDICSVSPYAGATPASVSGLGGSVASSVFDCPGRTGPVGDSVDSDSNLVPGAAAPVGAATVPATIKALNDLGIRVIGLQPQGFGAFDPAPLLTALAQLTGAVDTAGQPLVFDLNLVPVKDAILQAITTSLAAPVDVELVPDPPIPGLTITTDPPIHNDLKPGETACFDVTFDGDPSFGGGDFTLDFLDAASGSPLGTIPASLRCPDCLEIRTQKLLCETNPATGQLTGDYEWTFLIFNRGDDLVHHLFFVDLGGVQILPSNHLVFSPPIGKNQVRSRTVKIRGAGPGALTLHASLHDQTLAQCCAEDVTIELPTCECAQVRSDITPRCFPFPPSSGAGPKTYIFNLESLSNFSSTHLLISPVSPLDLFTPISPTSLQIQPNTINLSPPLGPGDETGNQTITFSGPLALPGAQVCFRLSIHTASFFPCCSIPRCVTLPRCEIDGPFEPVGTTEFIQLDGLVLFTGNGLSGDDGFDFPFPPSRAVTLAWQPFESGGQALLRFAVRGDLGPAPESLAYAAKVKREGANLLLVAETGTAPLTDQVDLYRDGVLVRTVWVQPDTPLVVRDLAWPSEFIGELGQFGFRWASPTVVYQVGQPLGSFDRVVYHLAGDAALGSLTRLETRLTDIDVFPLFAAVAETIDFFPSAPFAVAGPAHVLP